MSSTGRQPGTDSGSGVRGLSINVDRYPNRGTLRRWTAIEKTTGTEASGPAWPLAAVLLVAILIFESIGEDDEEETLADELTNRAEMAHEGEVADAEDVKDAFLSS